MTIQKTERRKKIGCTVLSPRQVLPTVGVLFCMLLFLRNPTIARDAVLRGLRISATNVIPSVFPFLVFSDLLLSCGGLPNGATKWMQKLFRLPASGCTAILLGWLCGFPVGARCAATELKQGPLTQKDAERIVAIASVPSPAFLIGGVGNGLFGNRTIGLFYYGAAISAAAIVGFLSARRATEDTLQESRSELCAPLPNEPFSLRLTDAVRRSALAALNICAYIVFFSAISAAAGAVLSRFGAPAVFSAPISCLLELSGGIAEAAALSDPRAATLLCAAAVGWTGFSVHFQTFSVCDTPSLRFGRYLLCKGLQAVLCLGFAVLWLSVRG